LLFCSYPHKEKKVHISICMHAIIHTEHICAQNIFSSSLEKYSVREWVEYLILIQTIHPYGNEEESSQEDRQEGSKEDCEESSEENSQEGSQEDRQESCKEEGCKEAQIVALRKHRPHVGRCLFLYIGKTRKYGYTAPYMANFLANLFSKNQSASFVRGAQGVVKKANDMAPDLELLTQEALKERLVALRERTKGEITQEADIAEVFALTRESARRTLAQRHYDVQLIGGLALARGKIAEMRTGEGKTLVATCAAVLRALAGKGIHIVTVNDYLARRDAAWMGQVYDYLGLSVGVVTSQGAYVYDASHVAPQEDAERDETGSFRISYDYLRPASKREAYAADLTYATNNELGFDYLRDNTAYDPNQTVQRGHHYAIIDEVDSILIDEARTPLIISGPAGDAEQLYPRFAAIAATLSRN
jgi:SecA DEAD-like domain